MPLKSSVCRGRLGQLPDLGEFVSDQRPDLPLTILNRVDFIGQGREDNKIVWDDSAGHVFPLLRIWETQRTLLS